MLTMVSFKGHDNKIVCEHALQSLLSKRYHLMLNGTFSS